MPAGSAPGADPASWRIPVPRQRSLKPSFYSAACRTLNRVVSNRRDIVPRNRHFRLIRNQNDDRRTTGRRTGRRNLWPRQLEIRVATFTTIRSMMTDPSGLQPAAPEPIFVPEPVVPSGFPRIYVPALRRLGYAPEFALWPERLAPGSWRRSRLFLAREQIVVLMRKSTLRKTVRSAS